MIEQNQKIAVGHVLAAICLSTLRIRLESDLKLSHHALRKNFKKFYKQAIRLRGAFQRVDNGKQHSQATKTETNKHNHKGRGGNSKHIVSSQPNKTVSIASKREPPFCLYNPHRSQRIPYFLRDCQDCPDQGKRSFRCSRTKKGLG